MKKEDKPQIVKEAVEALGALLAKPFSPEYGEVWNIVDAACCKAFDCAIEGSDSMPAPEPKEFDLSNPDRIKFKDMPTEAQKEMKRHLAYVGTILCTDTGEFPDNIFEGFPYAIRSTEEYDLSNPNLIPYCDLPRAVLIEMDKLLPGCLEFCVACDEWAISDELARDRRFDTYRKLEPKPFDLSNPDRIKFKDMPVCWLREIKLGNTNRLLPIMVSDRGILVHFRSANNDGAGEDMVMWKRLFDEWEHSTDGKTWSICGKESE